MFLLAKPFLDTTAIAVVNAIYIIGFIIYAIMFIISIITFISIILNTESKKEMLSYLGFLAILFSIATGLFIAGYKGYKYELNKSEQAYTEYCEQLAAYEEWFNTTETVIIYDEIVSLDITSEVTGSGDVNGGGAVIGGLGAGFVVGTSQVNTDSYYKVLSVVAPKTYKQELIKIDGSVLIKETDGTHYYVYKERPAGTDCWTTYIVVPEGTIIKFE